MCLLRKKALYQSRLRLKNLRKIIFEILFGLRDILSVIKNVSSGAALGPNWFKQKDLQLVGKGETKIKFGMFRAKKVSKENEVPWSYDCSMIVVKWS